VTPTARAAARRGTRALDGGSLLNQGIHYADLLRWCMGPVADVTAKFTTRAHRVETEDIAVAVLTFASGALGTIVTTTAAFPGSPQRLEITGTQGTAVIEDGQITRRALAAEGPEGYLSLEPHLAEAGRFGGFSGPAGFGWAAQALRALLAELQIPWR
jgi:UDP-N-acetyl-2-amino-2-deoxyglucuronate dehydrogenase